MEVDPPPHHAGSRSSPEAPPPPPLPPPPSPPAAAPAAAAAGSAAYYSAVPPSYHHLFPSLPAPQPSRWTFTQGLIVGQISMVVIALLLIRYVIFEDSATALEKERLMRLKISERRSKRHAKALLENAKRLGTTSKLSPAADGMDGRRGAKGAKGDPKATFADILDKIGYDISTHPSESTDWLNLILAQAVAGYREDVLAGGVSPHPPQSASDPDKIQAATSGMNLGSLFGAAANNTTAAASDKQEGSRITPEKERTARDLMEEILNRSTSKAGSFLDPIRVTEADFGDAYPVFTNARVRPADDTGRMRIEVDVDYSDQITLAIDTKLLINFPKPRFAVLPVSISLTIVRFSGTLAVELFSSDPNATVLPTSTQTHYPSSSASGARHGQPDAVPRSRHQLHFSLHPDFALEASASSLLGSRAKLQDIPKIEQLLISRLRGWILDRFVWPRYWSLTLPNLVPSPAAAAASGGSQGEIPEGEMAIGTGVENLRNGAVVEPGHMQSSRQEQAQAQVRQGAVSGNNAANGAAVGDDSLQAFNGAPGPSLGSVEAWRAQTHLSGVAAGTGPSGVGARPLMSAQSSHASLPESGHRPGMVGAYVSSPSLVTLNRLQGGQTRGTATAANADVEGFAESAVGSVYEGGTRGLRNRPTYMES